MAYTPEMNQAESGALRRIAWALEVPMTKAMRMVFKHLSEVLENKKVCSKCKDDTFCFQCVFKKP